MLLYDTVYQKQFILNCCYIIYQQRFKTLIVIAILV
jgi:hypothetical protein